MLYSRFLLGIHFEYSSVYMTIPNSLTIPSPMHESESEVAQSCPSPSYRMDCSPPGYSIHGIGQARVLTDEMRKLYGSLNILWHYLSLGLERKLTFSSPVATAEFSKFAGILSTALQWHHILAFEIAQWEFHHLH